VLDDVGAMVFVSVEKVPGVDEVDDVLVDKIWVSVSVEVVATEVLVSGSVVVVLGGHFGSVPSIVKVKDAVLKDVGVVMVIYSPRNKIEDQVPSYI
jgi:hypothetical protein